MNENEKLKTAQWLLERNLSWIAAAEVKVGVVVAIQIAMLGGVATAFSIAVSKTSWAYGFTAGAVASSIIAMACAAAAVLPRLDGPKRSLLFFGRIKELTAADYRDQFLKATNAQLLDDWLEQIHRNAEIAHTKHVWVRKAMGWAFFSAIPWICAIGALVKL
jgi:Family of unknown function (DUF5706)